MEEDIKILEEWIKVDREIRNNSTESDFDKFCEEKNIAIENLINRNKELEEENTALKKGVKRLKNKKEELSNELIDVKVDKVTKNYIPKSKIKEKIEELKQIQNTALTERTVEMMNDKISILKLLLEK